jgi:hypothetical protein
MDESERFRAILLKACDCTLERLREDSEVPLPEIRNIEDLRAALEAEDSDIAKAS